MAFKVPHVLATEEAQGPQEAIVDCVTRENAARISCSFQFWSNFYAVLQYFIDPSVIIFPILMTLLFDSGEML